MCQVPTEARRAEELSEAGDNCEPGSGYWEQKSFVDLLVLVLQEQEMLWNTELCRVSFPL